ncbi:MAG: hypothetical protein CME17_00995 [Gemmatimonadetes bacterium]|nr:hypothetical protein [Gemmatimonadota bacterium]
MSLGVTEINFVVTNLEAIREFYDVIAVERSTTGKAGPYTEITTVATRLTLVDGKTLYTFVDRDVNEDYYYRVRYYSTTSGVSSAPGDPVQGSQDPALLVLTVDELKTNYLFGLDMTDDQGNEFPESLYEWYIKSAVSLAEQQLDLPIRPIKFSEEPEQLDLFRQDYNKFVQLQLNNFPVLSVEEVKIVVPTDQTVINYNLDWLQIDKIAGQLNIIPGSGNSGVMALGAAGVMLPFYYRSTNYLPLVFKVKYTAGFTDVPYSIKNYVGMMAAIGPLHLAGDLIIGAGISQQTIGMDGLTQQISSTASATNSGFGARIVNYTKQLQRERETIRAYYKGAMMVVA